eukprot:93736_1
MYLVTMRNLLRKEFSRHRRLMSGSTSHFNIPSISQSLICDFQRGTLDTTNESKSPDWYTSRGACIRDLSDDLTETGGSHSLLMRLNSGYILPAQKHNECEEVLILKGELHWLNVDTNGDEESVQETLTPGDYCNRSKNVIHGPFRAGEEGCLMFVRYRYHHE